jgi:hypothetical protein
MPNALTGDFSAVLEVSGSTINRILASLHQSTGPPHLPHEIFIRVGDTGAIDGAQGTVRAQVSVPAIELIPNAEDRVAFSFWLRVWYVSDPYRTALPEFIYGVVGAEYGLVIHQIPQSREHPRGGTYGYLSVIPGSVHFKSATPDHSADSEITKQLEPLLSHHYVPSPSPITADFRNHRFKSLVQSTGSAVAHPLPLQGAPTGGNMASINQVFLAGKDFAVAVSSDYIISLVDGMLATIQAAKLPQVTVKVKAFGFTIASATYTMSITDAHSTWSSGTINLSLNGSATSSGSWLLPDNVDFSITQALIIGFNPSTESLTVTPSGPPNVSASVSGVFGGLAQGQVQNTVTSTFNSELTTALTKLGPQLQALADQKQNLVDQLHTLDPLAGAKLEAAESTADGLILRGSISLAPRTPMQRSFDKLAGRAGYSAFFSWIPGGRVTEYDWKWELDVPPDPTFGTEKHADRFLLLEEKQALPAVPPPPGKNLPLRSGTVCLVVRGVTIDPVTGAEVSVVSSTALGLEGECQHFYPPK